ncbi:DUF1588 domain-containing protein [Lignipirellula cremea]|uniref:Planctomycete cytochrome C n=1 Tax=Lignipirellula cremea TaxID=2528010 RepID=A0A518DLS9_9BACT|nr:DUF1588 domain-containing protein [Lignipirellula cremea]QDU92797.1 hypothetical protein Pla8534_05700 [Lignipirellula cremea]
MERSRVTIVRLAVMLVLGQAAAGAVEPQGSVEKGPAWTATRFEKFVGQHCLDCHSTDDPAGDVDLSGLAAEGGLNGQHWQRALAQLASGQMPPDDAARPALADREAAIAWLASTLTQSGQTPHFGDGPLPQDGNLVDHERLFSGLHAGPAFSPPRFWRRSGPQYDALMERLWVIPRLRYEKTHTRNDPDWAAYSYSQPFASLDPSHFTNYSGSVHADEAALRALLDAGGQIAERLTSDQTAYAKELQPPHAVGIPTIRRGSSWERFKQEPPARPAEFEPFVQQEPQPHAEQQQAVVQRVFALLLNRQPTSEEADRYGEFLRRGMEKNGPLPALKGLITAVMVSPEFVFRMEVGMSPPDEHGRRRLSPSELAYAIGYALTDAGPDAEIWEAVESGRLQTKADVARQVQRLLADDRIEKQRKLRFFQEFFGYPQAVDVFKDQGGWPLEVQYLVRDADMLVEHVLRQDKDVFAQLLTTDRYFVAYPYIPDPELFEAIIASTREETQESMARQKQRGRSVGPDPQGKYNRAWALTQGRELIPRTVHNDRGSAEMSYIRIYGIDGNTFSWTKNQPIAVPGRRAGILTHPAWLAAHSTAFDNSVVGRGHWIRENLLAGKIPNVPIDVEAQLPDEPNSTLRERMRATRAERCVRCHRQMDPLGFPFEIYDHWGQFREQEMVGQKKNMPKEINPQGAILASGDPALDGPVDDAIDLVQRLAQSPRVRQSMIRHAFRYWMGRNEMLSDAPTLLAADRAYLDSGGSFNAVIVSLLTSDSFLYRK